MKKLVILLGKETKNHGRGDMLHARFSLRETGRLLKQLGIPPPNSAHLRAQTLEEDMGLILILVQVASITNGRLLTMRPNPSINTQGVHAI
eukprot:1149352-Pelagomonas_calceolata.AAC.4